MASDRVPTRCCVACRAQAPKGSLLRIVRDAKGAAAFDPTGRAVGRGAYVCSAACFERARERRLLERALRCRLGDEDYERVAEGLRGALERLSKTEE